jgi:hypothetical protein
MRAAANYYQERVPGLGDECLAEVERVCSRLTEQQSLGPRLDAEHRRLALRRFPFRAHLSAQVVEGAGGGRRPPTQAARVLEAASVMVRPSLRGVGAPQTVSKGMCQECDQLRLGVPGLCHGGPGERAGKRYK